MQLNNLHSGAVAFNPFLKRSPRTISAQDFSVSRNSCSHSCTEEMKISADRSICVASVCCFQSSVSVLQKLEVVQGTTIRDTRSIIKAGEHKLRGTMAGFLEMRLST